jgi:signal transduction histidine kinase
MQAATMTAALLLVAIVLCWNLSFQSRLASSLNTLHASLALDRAIDAGHEDLAAAFWEAFDSPTNESREKYEAAARDSADVLRRYDTIPLTRAEEEVVSRLDNLDAKLLELTSQCLKVPPTIEPAPQQRAEVGRLGIEMDKTLRRLEDLQIQHLEHLNAQMESSSRWVTILLLCFGGFSIAAMSWFRLAHRRHLWSHLEELRAMVAEVRRGNLDIRAEIPSSIELGSLIATFLEMAHELSDARNLLEQKVLERTAKLEATQRELLQAAKLASLGELVSGVAHEINNPLTSILGFSEIALSRPQTDTSLRGPLATIREEALRLRSLVANLTSFARRAPHRTHLMDLRVVLDRLSDLRSYQLMANNVQLQLDRPDMPVWVIADPDQLLQVVLNLVTNSEQAIKDCRERGEIRIACGLHGQSAWLTVEDNGVGMDERVREHAFDPFFTTKAPGQGTGLGLSISQGIIEQHGGTIEASTKIDQGTAMRITLPLAPEAPPEVPGSLTPQRGEASVPSGFRALVIDDEEDILEMIAQALERLGCKTTLLHGSAEVEAVLNKETFDVVLSDLKMPGRNGLDVYRLVQAKRPQLAQHFLLMTGNLADADRHAAELASVPILAKPFTLARLRQAVEQLLTRTMPA